MTNRKTNVAAAGNVNIGGPDEQEELPEQPNEVVDIPTTQEPGEGE